MIMWSRADLENWADAILKDFLGEHFEDFAPIDIERLAKEYLGLSVEYDTLSDSLEVYGVSAFQDTVIDLLRNGIIEQINVKADTILLESALCCEELKTTHRFTLGHEAAHQILRRWERQNAKFVADKQPAVAFSRKTNTPPPERDWNEWQANTLGAALIMPRRLMEECLFRLGSTQKLTVYGRDSLDSEGKQIVNNIKSFLGVSKTSVLIRLKQLGLVEYKSMKEYDEVTFMERMVRTLWQERKEYSSLPKRTWRL